MGGCGPVPGYLCENRGGRGKRSAGFLPSMRKQTGNSSAGGRYPRERAPAGIRFPETGSISACRQPVRGGPQSDHYSIRSHPQVSWRMG